MVLLGAFLSSSNLSAQSLDDHRERLIADWASQNGYGSNVCAAWSSLSTSAKHVFVWNTHRLHLSSMLPDVTALYSIKGSNGSACGGGDYNRTFMSMTPSLQSRLRLVAEHDDRQVAVPWRETHDPACGILGIFGGECPHVPFTRQIETTGDNPTGQIQFFADPDLLAVTRQYRGFNPETGNVDYCGVDSLEVPRSQACTTGSCPGSGAYAPCATYYYDTVVRDPRAAYSRSAVGYAIADGYSFEMDQDYHVNHDSSTECSGIQTTYSNNYGNPNWDWQPNACAANCEAMVSPGSPTVGPQNGSLTFSIAIGAGCPWSATPSSNFLYLTSSGSGSGPANVTYGVENYTAYDEPRYAGLVIAGNNVTVTQLQQSSGGGCSVSVTPSSQTVGPENGSITFSISVAPSCQWSAPQSSNFLYRTTAGSGTGSGTVTYGIENYTAYDQPRSAVLAIAGENVTVTQLPLSGGGGGCSATVSPSSQTVGPQNGSITFTIAIAAGCAWSATQSSNFLYLTSSGSGTGAGSVTYGIENYTAYDEPRSAQLSIAGQTVTITQLHNGG
jgi:hypothetical protein